MPNAFLLSPEIVCPVCKVVFNSNLSFRETGLLVDEHDKAKHVKYLNSAEILERDEDRLYREKGLLDNDSLEFGDERRYRDRGTS